MKWMRFERSWRDQVLAATLPRSASHPGLVDAECDEFWPEYRRRAPILLQLGLRAAVWMVVSYALVRYRRSFTRLRVDRRDQLLADLANSRWYLIRQMTMTLKLVACLAFFRDPSMRKRFEGVGV